MLKVTGLVAACYSKSCAPPPTGTGGSKPGGSSKQVGGFTIPGDVRSVMAAAHKAYTDGDAKYYTRGRDRQLTAIYDERGFHGKARTMSADEFSQFLKDNPDYSESWRGLESFGKRDVARHLLDSDDHWSGVGVLGNGTYIAATLPGADPKSARLEAREYGQDMLRVAIRRESIMDATDASNIASIAHRITTTNYTDEYLASTTGAELLANINRDQERFGRPPVRSFQREATDDHAEVALHLVREYRQVAPPSQRPGGDSNLLSDAGRVSAILGFDAHGTNDKSRSGTLPSDAQYDYVVVFNRGALVADENVYADDGSVTFGP